MADLPVDHLVDFLLNSLHARQKAVISYANIHALNLAYEQPRFRELLNNSNITFCDGFGIKLAALFTGQQIRYRYTPPDFVTRVCSLAVQDGASMFFLGARPGVAEKSAKLMEVRFPGLRMESHHGWFDKSLESDENSLVIEKINAFKTDILLVGFGMPIQEEWIAQNLACLNAKIVFSVGALFDYLSGDIWRAPQWMTNHGLEWIARLATEPRRLWRRYIIGNPLFFWRVFVHHWLGYPLPR